MRSRGQSFRRKRKLGRFERLEARELLATITVTTLDSAIADDGQVSLPEAIAAANNNVSVDGSTAGEAAPVQDVIRFADDVIGRLSLVGQRQTITETVSIIGPGARWLSIDGGHENGLFLLTGTATDVRFENLRIANGFRLLGAGGIEAHSTGTLTLDNMVFEAAGGFAPAVASTDADLVVNGSTFIGSKTGHFSGSNYLIYSSGAATFVNATIADHNEFMIYAGTGLSLENTTVYQGVLSKDPASEREPFIFVKDGNIRVRNSIIHHADGKAFGSLDDDQILDVQNSFISNAEGTGLVASDTPDQNGNIIGDASITGILPLVMQPLAFAGGAVPTLLPTEGSPVIDSGAIDFDTSNLPNEIRGPGYPRAVDGGSGAVRIDMGASEFVPRDDGLTLVVTSASDTFNADGLTLREATELAAANPGPDTIRFSEALRGSEITLNGTQLDLVGGTTVEGLGASQLTISGNQKSSIFFVSGIEDVTISGLTLTKGESIVKNLGGAITAVLDEDAKLVIKDTFIFQNNTLFANRDLNAGTYGAVLVPRGEVEIYRSTLANNGGEGVARGAALRSWGRTTLEDVTVSGNTACWTLWALLRHSRCVEASL